MSIAGLNDSFETWHNKHGHDKNLFNEWKCNIIQKRDSRIEHLSKNFNIK